MVLQYVLLRKCLFPEGIVIKRGLVGCIESCSILYLCAECGPRISETGLSLQLVIFEAKLPYHTDIEKKQASLSHSIC